MKQFDSFQDIIVIESPKIKEQVNNNKKSQEIIITPQQPINLKIQNIQNILRQGKEYEQQNFLKTQSDLMKQKTKDNIIVKYKFKLDQRPDHDQPFYDDYDSTFNKNPQTKLRSFTRYENMRNEQQQSSSYIYSAKKITVTSLNSPEKRSLVNSPSNHKNTQFSATKSPFQSQSIQSSEYNRTNRSSREYLSQMSQQYGHLETPNKTRLKSIYERSQIRNQLISQQNNQQQYGHEESPNKTRLKQIQQRGQNRNQFITQQSNYRDNVLRNKFNKQNSEKLQELIKSGNYNHRNTKREQEQNLTAFQNRKLNPSCQSKKNDVINSSKHPVQPFNTNYQWRLNRTNLSKYQHFHYSQPHMYQYYKK